MTSFQFRLSADDLATRVDFLGFTPHDGARLRRYAAWLEPQAEEIAAQLYAHIQRLPELGAILEDHLLQCRVKQSSYLCALLRAEVDETYAAARAWVGEVHRVLGVEPQWYIAAFAFLLELVLERLTQHPELERDQQAALEVARSLTKLVMLDMSISIEAYLKAELDQRQARQRSLAELATPALLEVWEGVFVCPLVGRLDASHGLAYRGVLLQALARGNVRAVILDLTRLPTLDSDTGQLVFRFGRELVGLEVLVRVAGWTSSFERDIARLGVERGGLIASPSLPEALRELIAELDAA